MSEKKIPPDGTLSANGRTYTSGVGQVIGFVHKPEACAGRPCVIHNPSQHSMRGFRTNWRDGGLYDIKPPHMERICPHGIGHPDPDDAAYQQSIGEDVGVHGCDGCCAPRNVSAEHKFKQSVRALLRGGVWPGPKALGGLGYGNGRNLNTDRTRWRREVLREQGYVKHPLTGRWGGVGRVRGEPWEL